MVRLRTSWRKVKKRKPKEQRGIFWQVFYGVVAISLVVGLGYGTWYVTRIPSLTITEIAVDGGETISHDLIRERVERELLGSYVFLIPHRFAYTYPHDRIFDALLTIPRIHDIVVERTSRTGIRVVFDEYTPHALWCESVVEGSPCYFLSESGFAFSPAPALRGGALLRHVIENREDLKEGQVLSEETVRMIDSFLTVLGQQMNFRVHTVIHTKEGDIRYTINGGGELLVSSTADPEATLENLQSILESEEFNHIKPGNFSYIDLRFGNKVFVNEEFEVSSSTDELIQPTTPLSDV